MKYFRRVSSILSRMIKWLLNKKKIILISLINMVLLMMMSYVLNNRPLFTGENLFQYSWIEYFKSIMGGYHQDTKNDAVFINVGYDKTLIEKTDEFGMPLGNASITDRSKLTQLLRMLNKSDSHHFIFLDVNFERGYEDANADSLLIEEILRTKRIVIAAHPDEELIDSALYRVAAWNNYMSTIVETNFNRYQYLSHRKLSMPLYAYDSLKGYSIKKWGPIYYCNGRLCYNSLFLHFPVEEGLEYGDNEMKQYYNLGTDILQNYTESDLAMLCKGKYIFIGDMIEDQHDTYAGVKAGPIITYHAFKEIMDGRHFVKWPKVIFLMILFFLISMSLFNRQSWIDGIPLSFVSKSKIARFLMSFIGYTFILTLVAIVLGILYDTYVSVMLPSLYFSIQKAIIDFKRMKI